jgi:FixJ family two-component response regulator
MPAHRPESFPVTNRTTVAIVDDDASVCKALSRLLSAAGIASISYQSAEGFLADDMSVEPDCLILDIQLGGMSGLELQKTLPAAGVEIPIVFITAHDEPEFMEQARRQGCLAYLRKTDPAEAVLDAVRRASASRKAIA